LAQLILASASPRRADLLKQIGIEFRVVKSCYHEPAIHDESQAESIALAKARSVRSKYPDDLILGADTVVICAGKALGKPRDEQEAREMLMLLSGQAHKVVTGVALVQGAREISAREETLVWMRQIEKEEIDAYVASGEPFDKAGSYAAQGKGAVFVQKVEGCFFNVVGLPLARTVALLKEWDFSIW
jgi:septum formation protein